MKDPYRIYRIASFITEAWSHNPEISLGQLINKAATQSGHNDLGISDLDDKKIEDGLMMLISKVNT